MDKRDSSNESKNKRYMKKLLNNMAKDRWAKLVGLSSIVCLLSISVVQAQPKQRRQQQQQQAQQNSQNQGMTLRARLMFPTAIDMPEDVVWRRDIYREIDLNKDANAGLYYPVEPIDKQVNLFTYIFKLALNGYIPVYEYRLDGNEVFNDSSKVQMKTVLDNYHIFYEEKDGKIRVDNSDIPSAEVKMYYLKESAYYDQANATFHRKVLSLCPVMVREDDFGGEASKYPLFWVKYSDLEPFLSRQTLMTSNLNNAATMSMDDYFTLNRYNGKIYKTNNMLGKTLAQYCPNDSALAKEQQRIEAELKTFEQNIFGDKSHKDSLDSISKIDPKELKAMKKAKDGGEASKTSVRKSSKTRRSSGGGSSSGTARVSVRRQRH
ncbi:MAG: gliding motility protein GldN [Prevotella sp.]|nr:gliding motility protein GldN [Prevotella sp.]